MIRRSWNTQSTTSGQYGAFSRHFTQSRLQFHRLFRFPSFYLPSATPDRIAVEEIEMVKSRQPTARKSITLPSPLAIAQRVIQHAVVIEEVLREPGRSPDRGLPNIRFVLPSQGSSVALADGVLFP